MTNLREAAQMALDALNLVTDLTSHDDEVYDAIEALRAALAQPEQEPYDQTALELCEVCGWKTLIPDDGCLNCARTGKPVAFWRHSSSVDKGWHEFGAKKTSDKDIPLYTAPPQRQWQGLTVEEIEEAGKESTKSNLLLPYSFARAIEAKLKEKNHG